MRPQRGEELADFCEVCRRPLIARPVRRRGRCGAHPRQPTLAAADFQGQAHRIAEGMGGPMVRISHGGHGWIKVVLLVRDPLTTPMPLPMRPAGTSACVSVLLGANEYGQPVTVDFA